MKEDGFNQTNNSDKNSNEKEYNCYASKEEVAAAFEDCYKNVENFHKRLLNFTLGKIRHYFHSNTFRNNDAEDVVQTVIKSILSQKRKWYKNKIPDFHKFVRFSILSYIRNEWKRKDRLEETCIYDEEGNLSAESIIEILKEYAREDLADDSLKKDVELIIEECECELEDDVYASFVFDELNKGLRSNIKIAEKLKIEVSEVEKAKKRIKRKLGKLKSIKDLRKRINRK